MATKALYVNYLDKESLDSQFPYAKNIPHFQLSEEEAVSSEIKTISRTTTFSGLVLSLILHLHKSTSSQETYDIRLTDSASLQIESNGEKRGKCILEELITVHNDFVTPRRT